MKEAEIIKVFDCDLKDLEIRNLNKGNLISKIFIRQKFIENIRALMVELLRAKPASSKGKYIKSAHVTSTMGPSIELDTALLLGELR